MDSHERLEALVAPLRADVVSGAASVAKTAADILRRAAIRIPAASREELRWGLGEAGRTVLEAQPAMASLVSLVRNVLGAVEGGGSVAEGRHAAATAADDFRAGLEERGEAVVSHARRILPRRGTVATISFSSTVRATLVGSEHARDLRVVCFESRPMQEGRELAAALAREGIPVTLAVDAAMDSLVPSCDVVLFGADSIGDRGVVNKIGSACLAHAAARTRVPVYVLADESKILPPAFPQEVDDDRPADDVWSAPPGVRVWNRYFEVVPLEDVKGVVTESGVLSRRELAQRRQRMDFPEVLRRWAQGR